LIGRYDRICYEEFLRKENSDSITWGTKREDDSSDMEGRSQ
jgi:hypothetical protein